MIKTRIPHFGLWEYVVRVCFIFFFSIILFKVFAEDGNALNSFIKETIAFFLLTVFTAKFLLKDRKLLFFFSIAYLVKVGIGVWHYLTFMDPTYFSGVGETNLMHHEYEAVINFLQDAASEKKWFGLFHLKLDGYVTHQEILSIMAIPFHFFGVKMLGISPINSFFSLFAAMNVYLVAKPYFSDSHKNKCLLLLLAYFPATLLTDIFFRDIVGWCFMSIGLTMMCFSRTSLEKIISMLLAIPLFYLQRNGYIIIPILLLLADFVFISKKKNFLLKIIAVLIALITLPIVYRMASNESTETYVQGATSWPIYLLPIKIVVGLIGPFPWTNFLMYKAIPYISFYLGDYVTAIFNIGVLIVVIKRWKTYLNNPITLPTIMGVILLLMGIMNKYMHMTYISVGVFFLIPWIAQSVEPKMIKKHLWIAFSLLVLLNLCVTVLGVSGMASSVK